MFLFLVAAEQREARNLKVASKVFECLCCHVTGSVKKFTPSLGKLI